MRRLASNTVFVGFIAAWFLAASPIMRSESVNATNEGVVRLPWSLAMISTRSFCQMPTHEYVVPRSMRRWCCARRPAWRVGRRSSGVAGLADHIPAPRVHVSARDRAGSGGAEGAAARPWACAKIRRRVLGRRVPCVSKPSTTSSRPSAICPRRCGATSTRRGCRRPSSRWWRRLKSGLRMATRRRSRSSDIVYAQLRGRKRFVLFPADVSDDLYVFPRLHRSTRQSRLDLRALPPAGFGRFHRRRAAAPLVACAVAARCPKSTGGANARRRAVHGRRAPAPTTRRRSPSRCSRSRRRSSRTRCSRVVRCPWRRGLNFDRAQRSARAYVRAHRRAAAGIVHGAMTRRRRRGRSRATVGGAASPRRRARRRRRTESRRCAGLPRRGRARRGGGGGARPRPADALRASTASATLRRCRGLSAALVARRARRRAPRAPPLPPAAAARLRDAQAPRQGRAPAAARRAAFAGRVGAGAASCATSSARRSARGGERVARLVGCCRFGGEC